MLVSLAMICYRKLKVGFVYSNLKEIANFTELDPAYILRETVNPHFWPN
jgi:hypothetical protein